LKNIDLKFIDQLTNKNLEASLVDLATEIKITPDTSALIDIHLDVTQLAFNTTQGALLSNSIVKGQIDTKLNFQDIGISCSDLSINDDLFNVQANISRDANSPTTLTIEKPDAITEKIRPLLTNKIQKSILSYDVKGPLYAKAHLVFTKGTKKPRVNLDLKVKDKTVIVKDQVIKNADVSATFVNGFYDDNRQYTEHKKNMRLFLHHVNAKYKDFHVDTKNALITSSAALGARLIAKANINGKAASASQFLKHDKFTFQEGAFSLTTDINGRILEIKKVGEKTIFEIEGLPIDDKSPIRIQGEIDHLASVLFPTDEEQLQTKANIRANSISWDGLVGLFGQDGIISATRQDNKVRAKRSMKQTISGIQKSFHPAVKVTIDTVHYGQDVQLLNFNTGLKFNDDKTLILEETSFNIDKSNITLDGEVIINQLDFTKFDFDIDLLKPESLDANITYESFAEDKFSGSVRLKANPSTKKVDVIFGHSGHPRNLNYILESDDYRFDKGWFTISFEFSDNFESLAQMVEQSKIGLTINEAEVFITELGITVPLSRIEVASLNNKAYYYLLLKSDTLQQELVLDGVVDNIRHFAFKDTEDLFSVELNINSPRIVWNDLKQVMAYRNKSASQQSGKIIKESLTKVLQDFNPEVKLKVDKLEYSDQLSFNDIFAHAYLEGDLLKIDSANVVYGDSEIEANLNLNLSRNDVLPFDLELGLTNIDIAQTLQHFNYFNQEELRSAKQIEGNVWFDLDMSSEIDLESNGFITPKTYADIKVNLENIIIEDLETINSIAEKIKRVERFKVLKFAPIESHIKVEGTRITIEETEIQSNAMQAFVEGTIDKNSPENLWISVPVKNVKKPELDSIPDKTSYAGTGRKIFFKLNSSQSDKDGKINLRMSRKEYYKERPQGIKFKEFKKEVRRKRRSIKKALR